MRHRYDKDPERKGLCTCGQGRSEDLHNLMVWRKSRATDFYYGGPIGDVYYRIRCRKLNAVWWPEFTPLGGEENWTRIGDGVGVSLAQAKLMCEEHREVHA